MANIIEENLINLDPDKINFEDKDEVKAIFIALLNTIEHLVQENIRLREENQQLKDEIARLKGEKGKPRIKSNVPAREPSIPKTRSKKLVKRIQERQGEGRPGSYCSCRMSIAHRCPVRRLPQSRNPGRGIENG